MITVTDVKDYLRINGNDDDPFITRIISAGYDYLKDAVDDFDDIYKENKQFADKADLFVLTKWCPNEYDNREGMVIGEKQMSYSARSLITQLSLYKKAGESNES